jgi:5'-phosphate synthase pdxT subunit
MSLTNKAKIRPGILSFQGDIDEHQAAFASLGYDAIRVKTKEDLDSVTHLVMPGGESTTIGKILGMTGLDKDITQRVKAKTLTVFGTCAGAILLAKQVDSPTPVNNLRLIDVHISRNAYGSQIASFTEKLVFKPTHKTFEATFIRAPKIVSYAHDLEVLVEKPGLDPDPACMLRQDNVIISAFHPEYTRPAIVHEWFLTQC